jgi:predicted Zn-dependent protease
MEKIFYYLGKKVGAALVQARFLKEGLTGNSLRSLEAEYTLGQILSKDVEQTLPLADAPIDQLLIESLFKKLKKRIKNQQRYFTLKIVQSKEPNAFALPGGFIYISSALIEYFRNDADALAFVLAHEAIHVVARHPLKRMVTGYSMNALARIFKTGSVVGIFGKDVVKNLVDSHYSRTRELEADHFALRLMYSAGFDPMGAVRLMRFFQRVKEENAFPYFASHPPLKEREQKLLNLIAKL